METISDYIGIYPIPESGPINDILCILGILLSNNNISLAHLRGLHEFCLRGSVASSTEVHTSHVEASVSVVVGNSEITSKVSFLWSDDEDTVISSSRTVLPLTFLQEPFSSKAYRSLWQNLLPWYSGGGIPNNSG